MLSLTATSLGKKFNRNWIFRNAELNLISGDILAITGRNGSGKSTLLQMLAGYYSPSEGIISWKVNGKEIIREDIFRYIGFASPYMELIEELTLKELFQFYFSLKKNDSFFIDEIIETSALRAAAGKPIKEFSSGMKQRVKITMALCSNMPFVFLDEPFSNLDAAGITWYKNLLAQNSANRIIIICSNSITAEIESCNNQLSVDDWKKKQV